MRPKGNAPSIKASQYPAAPHLQQTSRSRREEGPTAASRSTLRLRRGVDASPAVAAASSAARAGAVPGTSSLRRDQVATPLESRARRPVGVYASTGQPFFRPPAPVTKKAKRSLTGPSLVRQTSAGTGRYRADSTCLSSNDRTRVQQKKPVIWNAPAKFPSIFNAESKTGIQKKLIPKKSQMTDVCDEKRNLPSFSFSENMCIMTQLHNELSMAERKSEHQKLTIDLQNVIPCLSDEREEIRETTRVSSEESSSTEESDSVLSNSFQTARNSLSSSQSLKPVGDTVLGIDPLGWERVLLSLQVQMSPVSSPPSSSVFLGDVSSFPQKMCSPQTHRSFQTTSEIMVLPIISRQHGDRHGLRLSEQMADSGIGSPIGSTLMQEIIRCQETIIQGQNLTNGSISLSSGKQEKAIEDQMIKASSSVCSVSDFRSATDCDTKEDIGKKEKLDVTELTNLNQSDKKTTMPNQNRPGTSVNNIPHSTTENFVTELQLNQNDILKMAYEIIDIVSQIEVQNTSGTLRDGSECRRGQSTDMIHENSGSKISASLSVQSMKSFFDEHGNKKVESTRQPIGSKSSESNEIHCLSVKSNDSSSERDQSDSSSENINIVNTFKIPKKLPLLLYQNKQMHTILKQFAAKLQENNLISGRTAERQNHFSVINDDSYGTEIRKFRSDIVKNEKNTTVSEHDTEKLHREESKVDAQDGDDEATSSSSSFSSVVSEKENAPSDVPGDPTDGQSCPCHERLEICPRHPAEVKSTQRSTCVCKRFQEVCTTGSQSLYVSSDEGVHQEAPREIDQIDKTGTEIRSNSQSVDPKNADSVSKSASWVPWVRDDGSDVGPRILDFNPGPAENVSTLTIPPRPVQNTLDLLEKRDDVSVFGSKDNVTPWLPKDIGDDKVPDTITEFHWMPDDLRAFSSTMMCPDIPVDITPYNSEDRPMLIVPHTETPEPSLSGFILHTPRTSFGASNGMMLNPDAPAEVPRPNLDVAVGGNFLDALSSVMEKSIAPLKSAIDELKTKIERMEYSQASSMRPDILVGVSALPHCLPRGGQTEICNDHGSHMPPFGVYFFHQGPNAMGNIPPCVPNVGNAIESNTQSRPGTSTQQTSTDDSIPCTQCIDKLPKNAPTTDDRPQPNSDVPESVRPPTPYLTAEENPKSHDNADAYPNDESSNVSQSNRNIPISQSNQNTPSYHMNPRCTCPENNQLNRPQTRMATGNPSKSLEKAVCGKCNNCNPADKSYPHQNCVICCNSPKSHDQRVPLKECVATCPKSTQNQHPKKESPIENNIKEPTSQKTCGVCKTCGKGSPHKHENIPFSSNTDKRCVHKNGPNVCDCKYDKKESSDYRWLYPQSCAGCGRCPPPPCTSKPIPEIPPLSPLAQMYLDMSRAKHDWSDVKDEVCICVKASEHGGREPSVKDPSVKNAKEPSVTNGKEPSVTNGKEPSTHGPTQGEEEPMPHMDSDEFVKRCCFYVKKKKKGSKEDQGKDRK